MKRVEPQDISTRAPRQQWDGRNASHCRSTINTKKSVIVEWTTVSILRKTARVVCGEYENVVGMSDIQV